MSNPEFVDLGMPIQLSAEPDPVTVSSVKLPVDGAFGAIVDGLLTAPECEQLMRNVPVDLAPPTRSVTYRNSDTAVFRAEPLAAALWERVRSLVPAVVTNARALHVSSATMGLEGEWTVTGLNPVFRMARYLQGGHFSPHYDSDVVLEGGELRSFLTVNIYLNGGDFEGGNTEFLTSSVELGGPVLSEAICSSVAPRQGRALIFSHHVLHQGGKLLGEGAVKYIFRTDVMYRRVPGSSPALTSAQSEALEWLHRARNEENAGNLNDAVASYRKSFRLWPELESQT